MLNFLRKLLDRIFFNDETSYFALFLVIFFGLLFFFGGILLPILISLVIAFLLNGLVRVLENNRLPRWLSLSVTLLMKLLDSSWSHLCRVFLDTSFRRKADKFFNSNTAKYCWFSPKRLIQFVFFLPKYFFSRRSW